MICMNLKKKKRKRPISKQRSKLAKTEEKLAEWDGWRVAEGLNRKQGLAYPSTLHLVARETLSKSFHFLLCLSSLPVKQRWRFIISEGLQGLMVSLTQKCSGTPGQHKEQAAGWTHLSGAIRKLGLVTFLNIAPRTPFLSVDICFCCTLVTTPEPLRAYSVKTVTSTWPGTDIGTFSSPEKVAL